MEEKKSSFIADTLRFALITVAIVLPIRFFVAEPFIVSGASMQPTFETSQYLIIDRLSYHFREPERGEVIVFRYPNDPSKYFIKRIIGLPDETVVLEGSSTKIINEKYPEGMLIDEPYTKRTGPDNLTKTLGNDEYFVLGDNRGASSDSRVWGSLPKKLITGRAFVRLLPVDTISLLPGAHRKE